MDDQLDRRSGLMNSPLKFCASLTTAARLISPLHSTSNDTVAGTGAIGGMVKRRCDDPLTVRQRVREIVRVRDGEAFGMHERPR